MSIIHDVVVIGAGFSGVFSALELARDYRVLLVEAADEILPLSSTSFNECYKLHTGMHYLADKQTALLCLQGSVLFAKTYPDFIAGGEDLLSPMRRGRHFIMQNSLVSLDDARAMAVFLQEEYQRMCEADATNKVFGEPKDFIRILQPQEYNYLAKTIPFVNEDLTHSDTKVMLGFETAESQVDMARFKAHLMKVVKDHPNITFLPNHMVTKIERSTMSLGYVIHAKVEHDEMKRYETLGVVNCSWQNIEQIDRQSGVKVKNDQRVNRIKVNVVVTLPPSLLQMNTSTFSCGPFCSMTLLPNGQAILTSEPSTNVGFYNATGEKRSQAINHLLSHLTLNHQEGRDIARKIIKECASYLRPDLKAQLEALEPEALRVGFVKLIGVENAYTPRSLYLPDSDIHRRSYTGIEIQGLGYISNAGMKMTYTLENSKYVARQMQRHLSLMQKATHFNQRIWAHFSKTVSLTPLQEQWLYYQLRHNLRPQILKFVLQLNEPVLETKAQEMAATLAANVAKIRKNSSSELSLQDAIDKMSEESQVLEMKEPPNTDLSTHFLMDVMSSSSAKLTGSAFVIAGVAVFTLLTCNVVGGAIAAGAFSISGQVGSWLAGSSVLTTAGASILSLGLFAKKTSKPPAPTLLGTVVNENSPDSSLQGVSLE